MVFFSDLNFLNPGASTTTSHDPRLRAVDSTQVDPKAKSFYDRAFAIYRQLYLDLRNSFKSITALVNEP